MAYRDSNQGFGFIYVDIPSLLEKRDALMKQPALNFNRDPLPPKKTPISTQQDRIQAVQQIRENLDRLQTLHHKLHAMLEDLNKSTKK